MQIILTAPSRKVVVKWAAFAATTADVVNHSATPPGVAFFFILPLMIHEVYIYHCRRT